MYYTCTCLLTAVYALLYAYCSYTVSCVFPCSSYLHAEWATFEKLLHGDRRFDGKVKRYKAKQASLGIFSNVDEEPFNPEYTEVDRLLDVATQTEQNEEVLTYAFAMVFQLALYYCSRLLFTTWSSGNPSLTKMLPGN